MCQGIYLFITLQSKFKWRMTQKQEKTQPQANQTQTTSSPIKKVESQTIGDYHTAPGYMKDNQHITHGYRINFDSPKKILKSLFMLHNESVNIWSHFLPALIICIAIISFAFLVDRKQIAEDMISYQKQLANSFDHYSHALDNLTLIQDMKHMRDKTQHELQELRQNAIESFGTFTKKLNTNMKNIKELMAQQVEVVKESVRKNIEENLQKFERMKHDYQKIIAPHLIQEIVSINNSYINSIKDQISKLKDEIDSDDFKYIDPLHDSPNPHHVSRWPLLVFLCSAFVCLMCSTLFHLFYPMSSKSYTIFSRFDYAGISILIAGSTFPPLYYGMYCYLEVAIVYEIIEMSLAITIFILSVFQWMHKPQHGKFKAAIYGGFGLFNIIPLSHLLINNFFFSEGDEFTMLSSIPYYVLLGFSYLIGLYVYTVRCPQRHYPGRFNLCGHSHQIWHGFVLLGVLFTYFGAIQNFQMRKNHACPIETF